MIQVISNTQIYQPIKRVFEFISKPENDFQWQYETLVSALMEGNAAGLGARFQSTGHFMGQRLQRTYEVTEYEPNQKYGFKSLSGPLLSFTTYTLDMIKGYTQVNLALQANIINLLDFNEKVLEKKMKRQFKEDLSMLKNILEVG